MMYWLELRRRVLCCAGFFLLCFALGCYYHQALLHGLITPLLAELSGSDALIATDLVTPVLVPLRVAWDIAWVFTVPLVVLQAWLFVAPGLYRAERRLLRGVVCLSFFLFISGVVFCFYVVLPSLLHVCVTWRPQGVVLLPDIAHTIEFLLHCVVLFGVCFQLPLVCVVLVQCGVLSVVTLCRIRPYGIVVWFTLGMLLTPPDVISQVMLAVPLCLLYEVGIMCSRMLPVQLVACQTVE